MCHANGIAATKFNLTHDDKLSLMRQGKKSAHEYLKNLASVEDSSRLKRSYSESDLSTSAIMHQNQVERLSNLMPLKVALKSLDTPIATITRRTKALLLKL